jgi:hypothetical protein
MASRCVSWTTWVWTSATRVKERAAACRIRAGGGARCRGRIAGRLDDPQAGEHGAESGQFARSAPQGFHRLDARRAQCRVEAR